MIVLLALQAASSTYPIAPLNPALPPITSRADPPCHAMCGDPGTIPPLSPPTPFADQRLGVSFYALVQAYTAAVTGWNNEIWSLRTLLQQGGASIDSARRRSIHDQALKLASMRQAQLDAFIGLSRLANVNRDHGNPRDLAQIDRFTVEASKSLSRAASVPLDLFLAMNGIANPSPAFTPKPAN